MIKRNDQLWKAALEDLFDDFLRFFYPDADELFDIEKGFEYLDKELDQLFPPSADKSAIKYVDKLVKVFTREGNEEWILIHIEVQGYTDKDFARRMFQYYYRILDQYDKPITAFAIFADSNKNFHPKHYERDYLGTRVYYAYNTYKIIDQDDAELEESNNPFALAVLSAKLMLDRQPLKDEQLFDLAYNLAKRLLRKQMTKDKIRKVLNFLRYYMRFDNQDMFSKFEQEISILTERRITVGIEEFIIEEYKKEAREEGIEKGLEQGIDIGIEKGLEKGIDIGIEKGLEKGIDIGIEQGIDIGIKGIALKMKENGLDYSLISSMTGLSIDTIEKLF